ncbi:MAG: hypothetical protein VX899_20015 [Myxococcota bacterium]|nr:hypothetical protein [Myxococcota bacterium]
MNKRRLLMELGLGGGLALLCAVGSWFVWEPLLTALLEGQRVVVNAPGELVAFKLRHSAAALAPGLLGGVLLAAAHVVGNRPADPLRAAVLLGLPFVLFGVGLALAFARVRALLPETGALTPMIAVSSVKLTSPGLAWCILGSFVGMGWVAMKGGRRKPGTP